MSNSEKKVKKEKKHKREVEYIQEEQVEPEEYVEKKKKEKKSKKDRDCSDDNASESCHKSAKTVAAEPEMLVADEAEQPVKEKKHKKHRREVVEEEYEVEEEPLKKVKKDKKEVRLLNDYACEEVKESVATPDNSSTSCNYWKRFDEEKYSSKVAGTKYSNNSHYAKGGDAWGNDAADRLSKVKGQGFRKEMQKLKRASWKGCGSIDSGVNSIQFSDWED